MKTIKYLAIGVLLTIVSAPVKAQTDIKSAIGQVESILKSGAENADKQIDKIAKPFKKDAKALAAIGRVYLQADNSEKAEEYANKAIDRTKNCGEAYILLADIAIRNDDGGKAAGMFQQAMHLDPNNPEGYRRYAYLMAKSSPQSSLSALEQLRKVAPDYPVDLIAAEISDRAGDIKKAIEYYSKVDKAKMDNGQLGAFATDLFLSAQFDKSLEVAQFGLQKSPRYAAFNRLSLYNYTEKKDFEKALVYADKLFNASDSAKFSAFDYQYVGIANVGAKNYDKAVESFGKILTLKEADESAKLEALKLTADAYSEKEDYVNAIATYEKYLEKNTKATATDHATLGTYWTYHANKLTGEEQVQAVAQADKVYADLAAKFADAAEFVAFQRALVAGIVDPELANGTAKPHWDTLIDVIIKDGRIEGTSKARLLQAYTYNMIYALKTLDDVEKSKEYAVKILEIEPENEQAKMVSELEVPEKK